MTKALVRVVTWFPRIVDLICSWSGRILRTWTTWTGCWYPSSLYLLLPSLLSSTSSSTSSSASNSTFNLLYNLVACSSTLSALRDIPILSSILYHLSSIDVSTNTTTSFSSSPLLNMPHKITNDSNSTLASKASNASDQAIATQPRGTSRVELPMSRSNQTRANADHSHTPATHPHPNSNPIRKPLVIIHNTGGQIYDETRPSDWDKQRWK